MAESTEYRGRRALEYAAQTGAQLMRKAPWHKEAEPIGIAVAQALWKFGAEDQIFCITVDHLALATTVRREAWQRRTQYALRLARALARISRLSLRQAKRVSQPVLYLVRRAPWPRLSLRLGQRAHS